MPRFDITIAGELNLDLILYGLPEQLSPERELLADGMMLTLGSSSAIVAHNLATLGSRVGFQSRIGDDSLGQIALDRLRQSGVDVSRVHSVPGTITTGLTVILQHGAWRNILTYAGTIAETSWQDLDLDALADSRHFHLSSYYLQRELRPRVGELFRWLKSKGLTISLDTNDDPEDRWEGGLLEVLRYVDVFLPNEREASKVAGTEDPEAAIVQVFLDALAPGALGEVSLGAILAREEPAGEGVVRDHADTGLEAEWTKLLLEAGPLAEVILRLQRLVGGDSEVLADRQGLAQPFRRVV